METIADIVSRSVIVSRMASHLSLLLLFSASEFGGGDIAGSFFSESGLVAVFSESSFLSVFGGILLLLLLLMLSEQWFLNECKEALRFLRLL